MRKKDENEVGFVKYYRKYQSEDNIVDISIPPRCRSVLLLHRKRANYVACIWEMCSEVNFELPSIAGHGWDQNVNICWIKELFPKDIEQILISDEYNENEANDEEGESD